MERSDLTPKEMAALELFADVLEEAVPAIRRDLAATRALFDEHAIKMARIKAAGVRWRRMLQARMERESGFG